MNAALLLPLGPLAGPILAQAVVPVYPTDSPQQLAARVLKEVGGGLWQCRSTALVSSLLPPCCTPAIF